jgi:hypothetical protein
MDFGIFWGETFPDTLLIKKEVGIAILLLSSSSSSSLAYVPYNLISASFWFLNQCCCFGYVGD